jgi:hypothetical protein
MVVPTAASSEDVWSEHLLCVADQAVGFRGTNTASGLQYNVAQFGPGSEWVKSDSFIVRPMTASEFVRAKSYGPAGPWGVFGTGDDMMVAACAGIGYEKVTNLLQPLICEPKSWLGNVFGFYNGRYQVGYPGGTLYSGGYAGDGPTIEMGHCTVVKQSEHQSQPAAPEPAEKK